MSDKFWSLREKIESEFDPSDVDASQSLAYITLKLMAQLSQAIDDDNAGMRLGRDQKGDMFSAIIEAATRLHLLPWNYVARDIEELRLALGRATPNPNQAGEER